MDNMALITQFYTAFARADAEAMVQCYADDIVFEDPAFGLLRGQDAKDMWRMLVNPGLKLTFRDVWMEGDRAGARWEAQYVFRKTGRMVRNQVEAVFECRDGKIVRHKDHFSFWRWSRQALGLPGLLLGWTPFLSKKVRGQASARLAAFQGQRNSR